MANTTNTTEPSPINAPASHHWEGIDGEWSTFDVAIGVPGQQVRLLPGTASQITFTILPVGCDYDVTNYTYAQATCVQSRGNIFNPNSSTTWNGSGIYDLFLANNLGLGLDAGGNYGLDSLALGYSDTDPGVVSLPQQILAGIKTDDYHIGLLALNNVATNFTDTSDPIPSFFTNLRDSGKIPSLTWSYTAGSRYEGDGVVGSLVFGGYDQSRFTGGSALSMRMADDVTRDLVVAVQDITFLDTAKINQTVLPAPVYAFIDSTTPYIWLPTKSCQLFERLWGLTWDKKEELYLVNDTLHDHLAAWNPTARFRLAQNASGGASVDIELPYTAFDLKIYSGDYYNETRRYFPLKRATVDQYTLGRTFLQYAYLTADYERMNFSLAQARFDSTSPQLVTIHSTDYTPPVTTNPITDTTTTTHHHSNKLAYILPPAIIIPVVFALGLFGFFFWRKRRSSKKQIDDEAVSETTVAPDTMSTSEKAEKLHFTELGNQESRARELPTSKTWTNDEAHLIMGEESLQPTLLAGSESHSDLKGYHTEIPELPGDTTHMDEKGVHADRDHVYELPDSPRSPMSPAAILSIPRPNYDEEHTELASPVESERTLVSPISSDGGMDWNHIGMLGRTASLISELSSSGRHPSVSVRHESRVDEVDEGEDDHNHQGR